MLQETNKYQTPITEELFSQYPKEVVEQFMDITQNVEYVKWLISPSRPYAKDCPHDAKGRVIVDLAHPHILENMDYFRQPALHYLKYGCYTRLKPNSNPRSEYRKFWEEEVRRIREGYVRESDGEWVTGFYYWFMNYNPMMVNVIKNGDKMAIRKESFADTFEGIYLRFHYLDQARHAGSHGIELARRGCAKSYTLSSIMTHNLILGENSEATKRVITVLTAYQKEYLSDSKDGTLSKFKPALNFIRSHTPFPRLLLKNSPNEMTWQMGYKDKDNVERGSLNQVMAVSAKDDSEKLRGKRGWILFEEMGSFKGLLSLYDITRKSVEDGDYTFATMYLVGTSAEDESDFSSAKTLLYGTDGYNLLSILNVYDKKGQGKNTFGYFFPAYLNRAGCYNGDGVTDVVKALFQILMARYKARYGSDPKSVLRAIAEDPITPAEAIVKVKSAYFPVSQLNERALQLDQDPNAYSDIYVGELNQDKSGKITYRPNDDEPIRKWGVPNNTPGALELFELPEKNSNGDVYANRYIIGHDPVDNDAAESSSLSSTFVFDLFSDKIVAEFTGRKPYAEENYEIARKLCLFYNAKCMYEANKKGIFAYFQKMGSTHLLAETPEYLRDKQLVKYSNFGSNKYGINATAAINSYADSLIREWLLKPQPKTIKDENGNDSVVTVPTLYSLRSRALIDELVNYSPFVNVDRIRALGMVMLYREEKMILYQGDASRANEEGGDALSDDPFFKENYDERFGKDVNLAHL